MKIIVKSWKTAANILGYLSHIVSVTTAKFFKEIDMGNI